MATATADDALMEALKQDSSMEPKIEVQQPSVPSSVPLMMVNPGMTYAVDLNRLQHEQQLAQHMQWSQHSQQQHSQQHQQQQQAPQWMPYPPQQQQPANFGPYAPMQQMHPPPNAPFMPMPQPMFVPQQAFHMQQNPQQQWQPPQQFMPQPMQPMQPTYSMQPQYLPQPGYVQVPIQNQFSYGAFVPQQTPPGSYVSVVDPTFMPPHAVITTTSSASVFPPPLPSSSMLMPPPMLSVNLPSSQHASRQASPGGIHSRTIKAASPFGPTSRSKRSSILDAPPAAASSATTAPSALSSLLAAVDTKELATIRREGVHKRKHMDDAATPSPVAAVDQPRRQANRPTHSSTPTHRAHPKRSRKQAADSASEAEIYDDLSPSDGELSEEEADEEALPLAKAPRSSAPLKRNHLVCGTIRARPGAKVLKFRTVINCGLPDANGVLQLTFHSDFFGGMIDCYTAEVDPLQRPLVRASTLADKFHCATNKIGMYLARRRTVCDGIYQATEFSQKPTGKTGLKCGGYFLTEDACRDFQKHYLEFREKKQDTDDVSRRRKVAPSTAASSSREVSANPRRSAPRKGNARRQRAQDDEEEESEFDEGANSESDYEATRPAAVVRATAIAPAAASQSTTHARSSPVATPAAAADLSANQKKKKMFVTPTLVAKTTAGADAEEGSPTPQPNFLQRFRNSEKLLTSLNQAGNTNMTAAEQEHLAENLAENQRLLSQSSVKATSRDGAAAAASSAAPRLVARIVTPEDLADSSSSSALPDNAPPSPSTNAVSSALTLIRQSLEEEQAKRKFSITPAVSSLLAVAASSAPSSSSLSSPPVPRRAAPVFDFLRGGSLENATAAAAAASSMSALTSSNSNFRRAATQV